MLKCFSLSMLGIVFASISYGQTYYTGWDSPSETAGWIQIKKGDMGFYEWVLEFNSPISPDSALTHYYPVGGSVPTDDWYISPVFDFLNGGRIDSLWRSFGGFGTPMTGDTIAIYVLNGSSDPDLASKTILYNYTDSTYFNDAVWRKDSNIAIPPYTGNSYIAFRYYTTNNWLDVKFDNLNVKAFQAIGSIEQHSNLQAIKTFPSPIKSSLIIDFENLDKNLIVSLKIININGQTVQFLNPNNQTHEVSGLENGVYFLQLETNESMRTQKIIISN